MFVTEKERSHSRNLVYISIFVVLIVICSWISIPLTVPFTLQTLGIFTAVGVLGGRKGTLAVFVYILLGIAGLPVFSNFGGGAGVLLGATGGYILGFLVSALLMWGIEKLLGRSRLVLGFSMVLGLLACYGVGTVWYAALYGGETGTLGIGTILGWCVLPFVIPDFIKIALALFLTKKIKRFVRT